MNLVLDSNIFISGLITPNGTISKLILRDLKDSILICPEFLFDETSHVLSFTQEKHYK